MHLVHHLRLRQVASIVWGHITASVNKTIRGYIKRGEHLIIKKHIIA
jgi:hypothetical protein